MAELVIVPAVVMGVLIGLIEVFFVQSDERGIGMASLMHGLHALPFCVLFVFASMNVAYICQLLNLHIAENFGIDLAVRIGVGLIAVFKITGSAAIARGTHIGEKLPHSLILGALIVAAPYLWAFVSPALNPIISQYSPIGTK